MLGSEPQADAPRQFLPIECVINRSAVEGSDLAVLALDDSRLPDGIKKALGLG